VSSRASEQGHSPALRSLGRAPSTASKRKAQSQMQGCSAFRAQESARGPAAGLEPNGPPGHPLMGPIAWPRIETPAHMHVLVTAYVPGGPIGPFGTYCLYASFTAVRTKGAGVLQRRRRVDLRLGRELVDWADAYARSRGSTRTEVVEAGLRSLREDARAGVPDLEPPKVEMPPVAPGVPGVQRASDLIVDPPPWRDVCPSCSGKRLGNGGFQHTRTCPGYSRV
jgi:hypothetical protein